MKRVRFLSIFGGLLFCAAHLPAAQRTFVSAANGYDSNPCSRSLPCRNFAAALPLTDPDGEVIVLDSGGYGAVTITQPVSLISPRGVHAGITAFSGNAVTVNAGDTAHVVLKSLSLSSQGGFYGIEASQTVAALYVESCMINGFFGPGIHFIPTTPGSRLYVSDTVVRRSSSSAIAVFAGTAIIDSVLIYEVGAGVDVRGSAQATVRKTVASAVLAAFTVSTGKLMIENSIGSNGNNGFTASSSSVMTMTRCASTSNTNGVRADGAGTTIYVSDSTITTNAMGLFASTGGVIATRGNNTVQGNTFNGGFNGSFPAN
jgi:parallel beta helix pectate lyase-like protein